MRRDSNPLPPGAEAGKLEAAHIVPFAVGTFADDPSRVANATIWVNVFRNFPALRPSRPEIQALDVNREENIMMMSSTLHSYFGEFQLILEATSTPHRYRTTTFRRFETGAAPRLLPHDGIVTLSSQDPNLLALH